MSKQQNQTDALATALGVIREYETQERASAQAGFKALGQLGDQLDLVDAMLADKASAKALGIKAQGPIASMTLARAARAFAESLQAKVAPKEEEAKDGAPQAQPAATANPA